VFDDGRLVERSSKERRDFVLGADQATAAANEDEERRRRIRGTTERRELVQCSGRIDIDENDARPLNLSPCDEHG
jgi:hypothetical protein